MQRTESSWRTSQPASSGLKKNKREEDQLNVKDTVKTADSAGGKNALFDRAPKVSVSGLAGEKVGGTRTPPKCIWRAGFGVDASTLAERYRSHLGSRHRAPRRGIV